MLRIDQADTQAELASARALFVEYAADLGHDLCFQHFDDELATLPGRYAPPSGALLLAQIGQANQWQLAGCVAMRALDNGACEMKRLWVRPAFRRHGIARAMSERIIEIARNAGHRCMRLDTLSHMRGALGLYAALGFREIPPYYANPLADVVYLECPLQDAKHAQAG